MAQKINSKTKKQRVLDALLTGNTLTPLVLSHYAGTLHISQIISDLKKEGYPIVSTQKKDLDGVTYAEYSIGKLKTTTAKQMSFGL